MDRCGEAVSGGARPRHEIARALTGAVTDLVRATSKHLAGRRILACAAPQFLWRMPDDAQEALAHAVGIAETGQVGDFVESLPPIIDQWPCHLYTQTFDGPRRRHPGGRSEYPPELAHAQVGDLGQTLDRKIVTQMLPGEVQRPADAIRARIQIQQ